MSCMASVDNVRALMCSDCMVRVYSSSPGRPDSAVRAFPQPIVRVWTFIICVHYCLQPSPHAKPLARTIAMLQHQFPINASPNRE